MSFARRIRRWSSALLRLFTLFVLAISGAFAEAELQWTWRNPLPTGATLRDVASSGTVLVAVGDLGTIVSSPNGVDWTVQRSGRTNDLLGVTWAEGRFVVVGESGTILTSEDGSNWIARRAALAGADLEDVVWAGKQFVAVGENGTIATSADGVIWTLQSAMMARARFVGLAWSGERILAVSDGTPEGALSQDGVNWHWIYDTTRNHRRAVTWGAGRFVSVGTAEAMTGPTGEALLVSSAIQTSVDGVEWIGRLPDTVASLQGIAWSGSRFVAVGGSGALFTSENAETWSDRRAAVDGNLNSVAWSGDHFVAVGEAGTILTSPDGQNWTNRSVTVVAADIMDVTAGADRLVAVGWDGTILTSSGGADWTNRTSTAIPLLRVAWNGSRFVALGRGDVILTSPDGVEWMSHSLGSMYWLQGVAWSGSQFVAVAALGEILTSPDGDNWIEQANVPESLTSVIWGKNQFVAVGGEGAILTSPDGVSWTTRFTGTRSLLYDVAWSGAQFVAVGSKGLGSGGATILTSLDGIDWTPRDRGQNSLRSVTWTGREFVAVGSAGMVLTSGDGVEWSRHTVGAQDLHGCTWTGTQLIAVGARGAILSADQIPFRPTIKTQPQSATMPLGGTVDLVVEPSGLAAVDIQWRLNGASIDGASRAHFSVRDAQPSAAGIYDVVLSHPEGSTTSAAAIVGISTLEKVVGGGVALADDIVHVSGKVFDQVLLTGVAGAITADWTLNQITRTSFIDLDDDIVQVEFSGPGTLSLVLDAATSPARPVNYNQSVDYVKGHAGIIITGADERTNVSVFTVGRATAHDSTGGFNFLLPISSTNDPANNGSPLFQGHDTTNYDGIADIAYIAISSPTGKFGGVRTANAHYFASKGLTGIYAPGVAFTGPIFIGDITAFDTALPVVVTGSVSDARITGGDLLQDNGQPVEVSGIAQLKFVDGSTSHGELLPAQANQAVLEEDGVDVTEQIVVNP